MIARTPAPPYWAVIFTNRRTPAEEGYAAMADAMERLGSAQPGFLGLESVRGEDGVGITISYWSDLDAIAAWRANLAHAAAQSRGRALWYAAYTTRIARVDRDYSFARDED